MLENIRNHHQLSLYNCGCFCTSWQQWLVNLNHGSFKMHIKCTRLASCQVNNMKFIVRFEANQWCIVRGIWYGDTVLLRPYVQGVLRVTPHVHLIRCSDRDITGDWTWHMFVRGSDISWGEIRYFHTFWGSIRTMFNCCYDGWQNAHRFSSEGHMTGDWTYGRNSTVGFNGNWFGRFSKSSCSLLRIAPKSLGIIGHSMRITRWGGNWWIDVRNLSALAPSHPMDISQFLTFLTYTKKCFRPEMLLTHY